MAQARGQSQGGLTAVHVWMIGFVFLWLTTTVLLVWLYTDQEKLKADRDTLQTENSRLARSGDKGLPQYANSTPSGPSMAGLLEAARKETAKLATGDEADDPVTVRTKVTGLFDRMAGDGLLDDLSAIQGEGAALLPAMSALYDAFSAQHRGRLDAEARARKAERRLQETIDNCDQQNTVFNASTDETKQKLVSLEQERSSYRADRDKEVDDFTQRMDDVRQAFSRDLQEKQQAIQDKDTRIAELRQRHAELQAKLGELQIGPEARLTAREADGRIVTAVAGDEVVYINLGRRHQLTTGLQFAVYPATGIPADGRAKARIRVSQLHESTAACKVVATDPLEVILEGDLVANPVYDRARPLRFLVVGEFDFDGDGADDADGAGAVEGIIREWGGVVQQTLSSRVDFVVAGFAPPLPTAVAGGDSSRDAALRDRFEKLNEKLENYNSVLASAAQLSIPILTQDVFLRFLGY